MTMRQTYNGVEVRSLPNRRWIAGAVLVVLLGLVLQGIWSALPPRTVVIETGPVGGSYHANALQYASRLRAAGLHVDVRPNPQSLQTVDHIQAGSPRVDIGFTAQSVEADRYPHVRSAGVIELQPLFVFYNIGIGRVDSLATLKGKRLVMPPERSATSQSARQVLQQFGVDPTNTRFSYLPIAEAAAALKRGEHDAGLFMLAADNPLIKGLIGDDNLLLFSFMEAQGIARKLDHLRPVVVPLGAYDLLNALPFRDTQLVAASVNLIVAEDLHPAVLYALLDASHDVHQGQTLISSKGDFPTLIGTALPAHPLAVRWAKDGTPWLYRTFSPFWATFIDRHWLIGLAALLLAEIYRTLRYLYELATLTSQSTALRILRQLDRRLQAGRAPSPLDQRLFRYAERVMEQQNLAQRGRQLLEQVRRKLAPGR